MEAKQRLSYCSLSAYIHTCGLSWQERERRMSHEKGTGVQYTSRAPVLKLLSATIKSKGYIFIQIIQSFNVNWYGNLESKGFSYKKLQLSVNVPLILNCLQFKERK